MADRPHGSVLRSARHCIDRRGERPPMKSSLAPKSHRDRSGRLVLPVKAVRKWMEAAGISEGPIFRPVRKGGKIRDRRLTAKSVCDLVKAYAGRLGLNAADFGGHSLRAGFLTSAARR